MQREVLMRRLIRAGRKAPLVRGWGGAGAAGSTAPPRDADSIPPPEGVPGRWSLVMNATGRDMLAWHRTLFGDQCTAAGKIAVTPRGNLALATSGQPGNCAEIASWRTFAPARHSALVIESLVRFPVRAGGVIPNWPAVWATVPSWNVWPLNGEIDIAEGLAGNAS